MAATAAAAAAVVLRLGLGTTGRTLCLPLGHAAAARSRFFQGAAARPRREDPTAVDLSGEESRESAEKLANLWGGILENKRYRDKEAAILEDIEPIRMLTKKILHSDRYRDGERLTNEDEKAVVENLLVYHPHSEDKIGCGIDCIMRMSQHEGSGRKRRNRDEERKNQTLPPHLLLGGSPKPWQIASKTSECGLHV